MQRKQIDDSNGSVIYWKSDDFAISRDTLFFLHGLTADHTMFESQIPAFERDYNIITWDAPAHGESRPYSPFTYENAARCMKRIVEVCGITDVILIGQSMGGFISQAFISRYPEMVKAFVSIDSTPYGDYYSNSDIWWLRQIEWMAKLFPDKTDIDLLAQITINSFGTDEFFINKAIGWALREYSKTDAAWVKEVIDSHKGEMSTLRKDVST